MEYLFCDCDAIILIDEVEALPLLKAPCRCLPGYATAYLGVYFSCAGVVAEFCTWNLATPPAAECTNCACLAFLTTSVLDNGVYIL